MIKEKLFLRLANKDEKDQFPGYPKKVILIISLILAGNIAALAGTGSFLTTWSTTTSTITIPVTNIGSTYIYNVTWTNLTNSGVGNGSVTGHVGNYTITGLTNGNIYQIEITGNFPGLFIANGTEKSKIRTIERWGDVVWTTMASAFYGCDQLVSNATDAPDVSQVTNMSYTFNGARLFNADLSGWNTGNVTTMRYMFYNADAFNGNIGTWNVSKVNDMTWMFWDAAAFNQNLNNWDVSKVTNMSYMFQRMESFNGNISNWNTVSATNMSEMFTFSSLFNQNIGNWNVSNVTNMSGMFYAASAFNQDLNSWDVSKVTTMESMFDKARAFNGNLASWNVGNVTTMAGMFAQADVFNRNISGWNVSKVTDMSGMFSRTNLFNQNLNAWDVSKVTTMTGMFSQAIAFNGDVSSWNVDNVLSMASMFQQTPFTGNISNWNVNKVTQMQQMFSGTTFFNGNLSTWNVGNVTNMSYMFYLAKAFNSDISMWNVSKVTNMEGMFGAAVFNQPLNTWNVSNVTSMKYMFDQAFVFNQDFSSWNVSKVTDMSFMFRGARLFNQNLNTWDVSKVTTMTSMFSEAWAFNGDISSWNVGLVTDMSFMFDFARVFNRNIGGWNVGKVTDMTAMFQEADAFNQNLNSWDVSKVTTMFGTFQNADTFNGDISSWNVTSVKNMNSMFLGTLAFNQNINSWNVSNTTNMTSMFNGAQVFNSDLSSWNVSKVTSISSMFNNARAFNQDITLWNVSMVTNMVNMFTNAITFNQNLNKWNISNVTTMSGMLNGTAISIANYDAILQGWATLDAGETKIPINVALGAGGLFYTTTGQVHRTSLDITRSWTITGDALVGAPLLPALTSFTPTSGPVSTIVTITGTNFSPTPSGNIVFFGATQATVTAATPTQLTVTVPAGATYKPISVLVNGLQAYSSKPFVVTFAGGGTLNTNSFAPKVDFTTGTSPRSVSIGDLDGDGKADMAISSVFSNAISIYRNTSPVGSITFAAKVDFSTGAGSNPYCVAIGDLDGDGKQDMAVVNYNNSTLSLFRNTSSGTGVISFATKVDFATGSFPRFVSIGDLDADGKPDLVVSNAGSNTISIFRNTSAGAGTISYAAKTDLTGTTGGMAVLVNDLDGDGRRDLAVANWVNPGAITTYRNTTTVPATISFAAKVDFPTGHNFLWSIAAGDLDNDGQSDLATPIASVVAVLRNSSTSGSVGFGSVLDLAATPYASFVSIDDLNGDGKVDLTVSNDSNGSVSVFENTSAGVGSIGFGTNVDFSTGTHPVSNAIADIDGDGRADLVVPNHDANTVSVLRNTMAATLSPTIASFTPNSGPVATTVIITGTNFSTITANNTVTFNGTAAVVSASTSTSITVIVPANATTGKITVTIAGNTATSATDFTVTTNPNPVISITIQPGSASLCNGASATFTTAASGTTNIIYQWQFATSLAGTYNDISNGSGYANITTPSLSVNTTGNFGAGFYRCRISGDMAATVFTNDAPLTITTCNGNQPPEIQSTIIEAPVNGIVTLDLAALLSDPDDNLDLSTLKIIVPPLSGAIATIDGQSNLILDYTGISFSGTEKLTIEVCDLSASCAQKELDIEVAGDVIVYNAISPNGDKKNDFLFLQYIEVLEETKKNSVTILNRWGSVVWEGDNYDNTSIVFDGKSKSGNELPSGNYFYKIEYKGGRKKQTGFFTLKR